MAWLLDSEGVSALADARALARNGGDVSALGRGQYVAGRYGGAQYLVAGGTAQIHVVGVLTRRPDMFARFAGGGVQTTYSDTLHALDAAARDHAVKRVEMHVDSPGGAVDGLFEVLDALSHFAKPIDVIASRAMSAAFAVAAATGGKIYATSRGATFGSIGVALDAVVLDELISITSTEAPDKRPDLRTEEGQATARRYLDAVHRQFVAAIAKGRSTTAAAVNETYGRGAPVLAGDALAAGMIDLVGVPRVREGNATREQSAEERSVDAELAEHYRLVASADAIARERRAKGRGRFGGGW